MTWAEWDQLDPRQAEAIRAASASGARRRRQRDVLAADVAAFVPASDRYQRLLATCEVAGGVLIGLWDDEEPGDADRSRVHKVLVIHPSDIAMLILGPPRSGKTSALLASMALSAPGPTVCVTTKADLYEITAQARSQLGPVLWFSPVGDEAPPGAVAVGWSPIASAETWSKATRLARVLVQGERRTKLSGGTDEHFQDLGARWLALTLFAANLASEPIETVVDWCSDPVAGLRGVASVVGAFEALHGDGPLVGHIESWDDGQGRRALSAYANVLVDCWEASEKNESEIERRATEAAVGAAGPPTDEAAGRGQEWVEGLIDEVKAANTVRLLVRSMDARERSGIFTTTYRVLRAYQQEGARRASRLPRFDAARFVRSGLCGAGEDGDDEIPTLYVTASDTDQEETAGVVCGLIQELRHAAHELARETHYRRDRPFLHLLLDECANIAPLPFLPEMASQAGGVGIFLACAFQDLSQARRRWGEEAQGFLSLFQAKVLLRGIGDRATLQDLSTLAGDVIVTTRTLTDTPTDVGMVTFGNLQRRQERWGRTVARQSISDSEQFRPALAPSELHDIPAGKAWYYVGPDRVPVDLAFVHGWFTPDGVIESGDSGHQPFWPSALGALRP